MKYILFILIVGSGCSQQYKLEFCTYINGVRDCSTVATFEKSTLCHQYKLIYQSGIDYEELEKKGKTLVYYRPYSDLGKYDIYCK